MVLAIIGLLAGLAIANIDKFFSRAQDTTTQIFVTQTLKTALSAYRFDVGDYPSTSEGLTALVMAPMGKAAKWKGPYLVDGKLPLDHWSEPYQYAYPGKHNKDRPDVWSKGRDKTDGTEDDIGNWDATPAEPAKS